MKSSVNMLMMRLTFIFFVFHWFEAPVFAYECSSKSDKLISRYPIVMTGPSWLFGSNVDNIEAWSLQKSGWIQVALQVDEVNSDGNYVLDEGLPYTKNTGTGMIDQLTELSVQGGSLGLSFKKNEVTKEIQSRFIKYRRVDFCNSEHRYLGSLLIGNTIRSHSSLSFLPLFNRTQSSVDTSTYKYKFKSSNPMIMGDVKLKTPQGDKEVFAGSSFIMPIVPKLFFLPSFYFGESDFTSEIECWRSGPVRSIVAVGSKMNKFFSIINLHLFSELVFYENYFQIPTKIEFIFDPSDYLSEGSGLAYVLKYPDRVNWTVSSNLAKLPKLGPVDLHLGPSAFEVSKDGAFSIRASNEMGSFIANVRVDKKALKQAPPPFLAFEDAFADEGIAKNWPWLKKSSGNLGVFIEISGVKRGIYDFALDVALSNQAHDQFTEFQPVSAFWSDPVSF